MADETIIIQYVVEADEATKRAEALRTAINRTKEDIRAMAESSGQSYKLLSKSIIDSFKSLEHSSGMDKLANFFKVDPETLQGANAFAKAQADAVYVVRQAYTGLMQDQRVQANEQKRIQNEQIQSTIQSANERKKAQLQASAEETAAMREYERITKQGYGVMSVAAQAYGQQVAAVRQQIVTQSAASGQSYQQVAVQMQAAGTNATVLNSALKELNRTTQQGNTQMTGFGQTMQYVFGTVLGMNAVNAIRQVIAELGEMMKAGEQVAESYFKMEVGVRALRRVGVDITSAELLGNLQRLNEETGNFYTQLELVQGASAFANLIRDMGFTREQIFSLQDAIMTLAIVNGRSMEEVQRTVALALSSGYTEGLQRLGLSINRVNIALRANEMGYEGGYTALTEYQRAQATLSLIMEKSSNYGDDLNEAQTRLFGSIKSTRTETENLKNAIGEQLLPVWLLLLKAFKTFIDFFANLPLSKGISAISSMVQVVKVIPNVFEAAGKSTDNFFQKAWKVFSFLNEAANAWQKRKPLGDVLSKYMGFGQDELTPGTPDLQNGEIEAQGEEQKDYLTDLYNDIQREYRQYANRQEEKARDLARDLAEIDRDLASDLEQINRDKLRDLEEIDRDLARDLADLDRKLADDRAEIWADGQQKIAEENEDYAQELLDQERDYQNKVEDEKRKYADNELEEERKHQEDLRQLREEYLFDLEDALHERDARKVLSLNRRYNLDREQAQREYENEKSQRREDHQDELDELRRERDERMAQAAEEHAQNLARIQRETAERIAERQREYERDRADRILKAAEDRADAERDAEIKRQEREIRAQEEREERKIQHEEDLEELKIQSDERIAEIIAQLASEKDMTAAALQGIANEYARIYGPNGVIDAQMTYWVRLLAQRAAEARAIMSSMSTIGGMGSFSWNENIMPGGGSSYDSGGGGIVARAFGEGGTMIADEPTHVIFGDKGPEKATFKPLGRTGRDENKLFGAELVPTPGREDRLRLQVTMDPKLIGEIQESTLDKAADIMFEVQRRG